MSCISINNTFNFKINLVEFLVLFPRVSFAYLLGEQLLSFLRCLSLLSLPSFLCPFFDSHFPCVDFHCIRTYSTTISCCSFLYISEIFFLGCTSRTSEIGFHKIYIIFERHHRIRYGGNSAISQVRYSAR